ncbi:MAG TPA: homocysteine S-methyltransferase family protein [Candidatus Kapabacteria bacterium]|nr:homocysteine S-methyltransferase family protein [Candidatus Kapabacteria bacterium]
MNVFQKELGKKRVLLLDGPMGTELERRGVPTPLPAWSAKAIETHPYIIYDIHKDYLSCGVDILTTNTFRTNRRAMKNAGMEEKARSLTTHAVEIAKDAIAKYSNNDVMIAGSVAPVEDCYSPELVSDEETLFDEHSEFISWLAEDGVDAILIETMNTLKEARVALNAAKKVCTLPVLVSLVCGKNGRLLSRESLFDAVKELSALSPDALLLNCASPYETTEAMNVLSQTAATPFGAYANSSAPDEVTGWKDAHTVTIDEYCAEVRSWLANGASIVGGCCGTTPEYIRTMRKIVDENIRSLAQR